VHAKITKATPQDPPSLKIIKNHANQVHAFHHNNNETLIF